MKLDKSTAIARRNEALERPVLNKDNTLLAVLDPKRNLWWFDVPAKLLHTGQTDWINLLLHTPEGDLLQHLKVPINYLAAHVEALDVRNPKKRRPTISLALSAERDALFTDTRPDGGNLKFAQFLQA